MHAGVGRTFVFATSELSGTLPGDCVGGDGRPDTAQPGAVDIVTPSSWSKRAFLRAGYPPHRVHVVPHGIDPAMAPQLEAEARIRLRQSLRLLPHEFAFLSVGAMTWNKGIGPLIAAFAVHRRSHPESVLLLKGGDALYGNIIQNSLEEAGRLCPEARDPALIEAIRYINVNLSREVMGHLYRAADAYVSSYRAEGFNLPVLEAMAAELPVLVTRGGATEDYCAEDTSLKIEADLIAGDLGEYLEPRLESIVEQMGRVVEHANVRATLARSAREFALKRFSWEYVTDRLAHLLLT
jgi:glycosyltransferase involved in cell wall biosynthesis